MNKVVAPASGDGCWCFCVEANWIYVSGCVCVALVRKAPFSCKAPPSASGEAPGLFGYSHSNACGEEGDVRQAMLVLTGKVVFSFQRRYKSILGDEVWS